MRGREEGGEGMDEAGLKSQDFKAGAHAHETQPAGGGARPDELHVEIAKGDVGADGREAAAAQAPSGSASSLRGSLPDSPNPRGEPSPRGRALRSQNSSELSHDDSPPPHKR